MRGGVAGRGGWVAGLAGLGQPAQAAGGAGAGARAAGPTATAALAVGTLSHTPRFPSALHCVKEAASWACDNDKF